MLSKQASNGMVRSPEVKDPKPVLQQVELLSPEVKSCILKKHALQKKEASYKDTSYMIQSWPSKSVVR